jgi:REP element-mobilizing transposase RayT
LTEYGGIVEKYITSINHVYQDVILDKYIIMPNHVHMILTLHSMVARNGPMVARNGPMWASAPTAAKIPSVVRSLKTLVAKDCGFSFWQRSYHDHIIRNEAEYRKIWLYIDENPARWTDDCFYPHL